MEINSLILFLFVSWFNLCIYFKISAKTKIYSLLTLIFVYIFYIVSINFTLNFLIFLLSFISVFLLIYFTFLDRFYIYSLAILLALPVPFLLIFKMNNLSEFIFGSIFILLIIGFVKEIFNEILYK